MNSSLKVQLIDSMSDAGKAQLIMAAGIAGFVIGVMLILMTPHDIRQVGLGIIVSISSIGGAMFHPRARHYNRAVEQFDKTYHYQDSETAEGASQ